MAINSRSSAMLLKPEHVVLSLNSPHCAVITAINMATVKLSRCLFKAVCQEEVYGVEVHFDVNLMMLSVRQTCRYSVG
jgi:hypothetical protein